jgi:glutaconate CoA-transferase subunit A
MDKVRAMAALVDAVGTARTISFGGGGLVRKPMAAAAAIGLSSVEPLDLCVLLGGPEVDVLIGMGKVRRLHFAFVGLGPIGLAPNFRRARENGGLEVIEASEYLILAGLEAAARGVPFLPTRSGLGTDILTRSNTPYREFACPLTGQPLVAVPALDIDVAVFHVNIADRLGNCLIFGEVFADHLLARAAKRVWVTAERVVDELPALDSRPAATFISRIWVSGVVVAPDGAGFTGVFPDRPQDLAAAAAYRRSATDGVWLASFAKSAAELAS